MMMMIGKWKMNDFMNHTVFIPPITHLSDSRRSQCNIAIF